MEKNTMMTRMRRSNIRLRRGRRCLDAIEAAVSSNGLDLRIEICGFGLLEYLGGTAYESRQPQIYSYNERPNDARLLIERPFEPRCVLTDSI